MKIKLNYKLDVCGDPCKLIEMDYQRNGVGGEGFFVFSCECDGKKLIITVSTEDDGETLDYRQCRVVNPIDLDDHWRGDCFGESIKSEWKEIYARYRRSCDCKLAKIIERNDIKKF